MFVCLTFSLRKLFAKVKQTVCSKLYAAQPVDSNGTPLYSQINPWPKNARSMCCVTIAILINLIVHMVLSWVTISIARSWVAIWKVNGMYVMFFRFWSHPSCMMNAFQFITKRNHMQTFPPRNRCSLHSPFSNKLTSFPLQINPFLLCADAKFKRNI